MKKNNKLISYVFIAILMIGLSAIPIKHFSIKMGWSKLILDGNWKSQLQVKGNALERLGTKLENMKISVENRTNNYFPYYDGLNGLYHKVNRSVNSLIYKNMIPIGTNTDGEYVVKDNDSYYINSSMASEEIEKRVKQHIELYNDLNNITPLYIYLPHRYEFQKNIANKSFRDMNVYVEDFKTGLSSDIKVSELITKDKNDYSKLFFKSDHHWSCEGSNRGYIDIMNLLEVDKFNQDYECIKVTDNYLGSIANRFRDKNSTDTFAYIDTKDLNYQVLINDKEKDNKFKAKVLDKKKAKDNIFYDYYIAFYYGFYGRVIYDFNNDKENLLILADSYSWAIDDLIASNFNKTHVINLMFDEYQNGKFDYAKYIKDNNINKVLILQETPTTIYDVFDHGLLEKVVR